MSKEDKSKNGNQEERFEIYGFDYTNSSSLAKFFIASSGIFVFFLSFSIFHEWFFRTPGLKQCGGALTMYMFVIVTTFSAAELFIINKSFVMCLKPFNEHKKILISLGVLSVGTMMLSNKALGLLNYPTQNIFKSSKIIPVMIVGVFLQGKRYNVLEYLGMISVVIGLICFTLQDASISPEFHATGVVLICFALLFDGVFGNVQELGSKKYHLKSIEMIFYSYLVGSGIIFTLLLVDGEMGYCLRQFNSIPLHAYGIGGLVSFNSYVGVKFIYLLIRSHGALATVTVTTCRKALTLMLSFIIFQKPFAMGYLWSALLVISGIYMNLYGKNRDRWNANILQWLNRRNSKKMDITTIV